VARLERGAVRVQWHAYGLVRGVRGRGGDGVEGVRGGLVKGDCGALVVIEVRRRGRAGLRDALLDVGDALARVHGKRVDLRAGLLRRARHVLG
jgi:hypothetical protein